MDQMGIAALLRQHQSNSIFLTIVRAHDHIWQSDWPLEVRAMATQIMKAALVEEQLRAIAKRINDEPDGMAEVIRPN